MHHNYATSKGRHENYTNVTDRDKNDEDCRETRVSYVTGTPEGGGNESNVVVEPTVRTSMSNYTFLKCEGEL